MPPIRVLLVDDSVVDLAVLQRLLGRFPEIQVVGTARTGVEGLAQVARLQPDVILTDLHMPELDGLGFTQELMVRDPRPVLVLSASVDDERVFRLMEAGALDVRLKPRGGSAESLREAGESLASAIRVISGVKVIRRRPREPVDAAALASPAGAGPLARGTTIHLVVIGASTGGPQAISTILSGLPAEFPAPVLVVQHITAGFLQGFIDWLRPRCRLEVRIATHGERARPGVVYFPQEGMHLTVTREGALCTNLEPPVDGHRPSVTVTMRSAAEHHGARAAGVLLTGMGRDGAKGLLAIREAGGATIAQDQATSLVFGMPGEAIALGAAKHVLPVGAIAGQLVALCRAG